MSEEFGVFDGKVVLAVDRARGVAAEQEAARGVAQAVVANALHGAWTRFEAAARMSGQSLVAERSAADRTPPNITLTWQANAPVRQLTLGPANVAGYMFWELRADFTTVGVYQTDPGTLSGVVPGMELAPDVIESLILALLEQEVWGVGRMPNVEVPGSTNI